MLAGRRFFSEHGNFGLRDVVFFEQGTMPCFGLDGQILLDTPGEGKQTYLQASSCSKGSLPL